jgi:hypothetical protein
VEPIIVGLVVVVPVPWSAARVALSGGGRWCCNPSGTPHLCIMGIGLGYRGRGRRSADSIRLARIGLGRLLGSPWAPLDWSVRTSLAGLLEPSTWLAPVVTRVALISSARATCLERNSRRDHVGTIAGRRRHDRWCRRGLATFRVSSSCTLRRRNPKLVTVIPGPYGPRRITPDYRPVVNVIRTGRGPGRIAPYSLRITVNALNLHNRPEDIFVIALRGGICSGRRQESHRPKPRYYLGPAVRQ